LEAYVPIRCSVRTDMASILIVDDEASIRSLLRRILEEDGHQIREAANGHSGLTLYRDAPADVVMMDILMPKQDGPEVTSDCHHRRDRRSI
jgi:CheY-like chemotaxis protein